MVAQDTSLLAFAELQQKKDQLGRLQQEVYEYLLDFPDSTDKEISEYLGLPINVVVPRRNELMKQEIVKTVESRKCSITGRMALCWRVGSD